MTLLCVAPLCACGKKPVHVDLPQDAQGNSVQSTFPQTYPNPKYNQ